jgi:hypothetical protein
MDISSTLHKSLHSNWTTPILCRNLANAGPKAPQLLEGIRSSFDSYETKVKLKILLSFLGVNSEVISANAMIIKQILEEASQSADSWVTNVAGIVHKRLFTTKAGYESIEEPINQKFDSIMNNILQYLNETSSNPNIGNTTSSSITDGEDPFYFQPHEAMYIVDKDFQSMFTLPSEAKVHFQYVGKQPNFLQREKLRGSERTGTAAGVKRTFALAETIKSDNRASLLFSSSSARALPGNRTGLKASLMNDGSKDMKSQHRKPMQVLDISAVKEIEEANKAALTVKADVADAAPKKRAKIDPESSSSSMKPTTSTSIPHLTSEGNNSTSTTQATGATTESHVAMKAPDLDALFAESPLLSDSDKATIRNFFSSEGPALFPPGTPELKFNLSKQEKPNASGEVIIETIRLKLVCTPHQNWQKSRSTKAKDKT